MTNQVRLTYKIRFWTSGHFWKPGNQRRIHESGLSNFENCFTDKIVVQSGFNVISYFITGQSTMEDNQIDRIFCGNFELLPLIKHPLVRIYTSSTYTDMTLEKTVLVSEVYPKLKEYCRERYGLEFQVRFFFNIYLNRTLQQTLCAEIVNVYTE